MFYMYVIYMYLFIFVGDNWNKTAEVNEIINKITKVGTEILWQSIRRGLFSKCFESVLPVVIF